jgi:dTDP-4-amino-4,6-dideoxygalactose transaminase
MVLTDSEDAAHKLRSLRAHGSLKKYFSVEQGWNSRLDELQAAILRVKLRYLDGWGQERRSRAARYSALLRAVPNIVPPITVAHNEHVFHQYTVRVPQRDQVQKELSARGIASTVYYPTAMHQQPLYACLGYKRGELPEAERAAEEVLSLPIYPELSDEQIEYVVAALDDAVNN